MKCNYKVGDTVKVRCDLSEEHGASPLMTKRYAGEVVTIKEVDPPMPVLGIKIGAYYIEEDKQRYLWSDSMFDGLVSRANPAPAEEKPANPMPKLTTGMFGKEDDGDIFVVVGDTIVYQNGLWESVDDMTDGSAYLGSGNIVALYDTTCFDCVKDGTAEVIWERDKSDKSDESEEKDDKDDKDDKSDTMREFIKALEELATLLEGKGDKE